MPKALAQSTTYPKHFVGQALGQALRPFVIGRKNWLFSNTVKGANASAVLYSLIETAKANQHEPYHYLRWLFTELPKTPEGGIERLMPWSVDPIAIRVF